MNRDSPASWEPTQRLIVAGFGGQGILTLGKLLCSAALHEGRNVTYLPSYGTEVRGGTANCQVVISSRRIYSPLIEEPDSLIILNELSYEKFGPRLRSDGLMVLNTSGVDLKGAAKSPETVLSIPAADMAAELGNVQVTNVVMLGAFLAARPLVQRDTALAALEDLLGERKADLLDINVEAFEEGRRYAAEAGVAG